jgi:hypothetical protein
LSRQSCCWLSSTAGCKLAGLACQFPPLVAAAPAVLQWSFCTCLHAGRLAGRRARQAGRQAGRQARHVGRQAGWQAGKKREAHLRARDLLAPNLFPVVNLLLSLPQAQQSSRQQLWSGSHPGPPAALAGGTAEPACRRLPVRLHLCSERWHPSTLCTPANWRQQCCPMLSATCWGGRRCRRGAPCTDGRLRACWWLALLLFLCLPAMPA